MDERQALEEIECVLSEISRRQEAQEEQEETPPLPEGETQIPPAPHEHEQYEKPGTTIIHVYVVDAPLSPLEEDERTIESTLEAAEEQDSTDDSESEPPLPVTHPLSFRGNRVGLPSILLVLCLLLAVVMLFVYLVPLLAASATVTIIPAALEVSSTTTVTLVTGTTHQGPAQVAGRLLSTLMLSQEQMVPTTGRGHQHAQVARGAITFYNALPDVQTVLAGTLLVGADGVQVVTEEDAGIPAAQMPTEGQVSVSAHALEAGPAGNIRANDLYGACCRADVFAQNSAAFHGGQNARDFPMVMAQDISKVVTTLKASLQESVQAALHTQVQPGETLITPVPCTPKVSANHAAGDEATHVSVRLDETCTGETYDTQALHAQVSQVVTQQATAQLGTGYSLTGDVQAMVTQSSSSTDQKDGTITLQVTGTGTWAYQFDDAHLQQIAKMIAGKSRQQATQILLHFPGVNQVSMTLSGTDSSNLPADASRIHLLVLYRSA